MIHKILYRSTLLVCAICVSVSVAGQPGTQNKKPEPRKEAIRQATFDEGSVAIQRMFERLVGSYHTGQYTLHIVRVHSPGMPFALYVELSRFGQEIRPERQQVWWLIETPEGIRIRVNTFPPRNEFLLGTNSADIAVGMWAAPDMFPLMRTDGYVTLGDLLVEWEDEELRLDAEYPHAIAFGGAMHSDTHHVITTESFTWMEQGFDADGNLVWGDAPIEMQRMESTPQARVTPSGLRIIVLREGTGLEVTEGTRVALHYEGFTPNGLLLESSRIPPFSILISPIPLRANRGMQEGVIGMKAPFRVRESNPYSGEVRRIIIPPELGYPNGAPPVLKPNRTLIFNLLLQSVNPNPVGAPPKE